MKFHVQKVEGGAVLVLGFTPNEKGDAVGIALMRGLSQTQVLALAAAWRDMTPVMFYNDLPYVTSAPLTPYLFIEVKNVGRGAYLLQVVLDGQYIRQHIPAYKYKEIQGTLDAGAGLDALPPAPLLDDDAHQPDADELAEAARLTGVSADGLLPDGRPVDAESALLDPYKKKGVSYTPPSVQ